MRIQSKMTLAVALCGALLAGSQAQAAGSCVDKTASGTGTTKDIAMFEAWEAVLQATDWGVWTTMMASKWEVGYAPGMKVSNMHSRCSAGGMGTKCFISARLCR